MLFVKNTGLIDPGGLYCVKNTNKLKGDEDLHP